jgi:hypothetical protein
VGAESKATCGSCVVGVESTVTRGSCTSGSEGKGLQSICLQKILVFLCIYVELPFETKILILKPN